MAQGAPSASSRMCQSSLQNTKQPVRIRHGDRPRFHHPHHDVHRRQPLVQAERLADRPLRPIAVHGATQHLLRHDEAEPSGIRLGRSRGPPQRRHGRPRTRPRKHGVEIATAQYPPHTPEALTLGLLCWHGVWGDGGVGGTAAASGSGQPTSRRPSLTRRELRPPLHRQPLAPLGASRLQHLAAVAGGHPRAKAVAALPLDDAWLVCPFHLASLPALWVRLRRRSRCAPPAPMRELWGFAPCLSTTSRVQVL